MAEGNAGLLLNTSRAVLKREFSQRDRQNKTRVEPTMLRAVKGGVAVAFREVQ
jgi:hypothetical protein